LISNFRRVLNVVCFLLGYSRASEFPNGKANFEPNPFSCNTPTFLNLIHSTHNHQPMTMEQTECSEMSAHKIQTPGNNPEDIIKQLLIFAKQWIRYCL